MKLAYEGDMVVGVFSDDVMAVQWVSLNPDEREVYELPLLDKTFATLAVEYNSKYEG